MPEAGREVSHVEVAELGQKVSKKDYQAAVPDLRTSLLRVQNELVAEAPFSVLVVIAGVDGAGKGDTVNLLHEWMDPRYLETHAFGTPTDEERERPPTWRFWRVMPPKGRTGIYFGSWYTAPILARVKAQISDAELAGALDHVKTLEQMLVDDGTLLVKLWFHLSKKAQRKRLERLSEDPDLSWQISDRTWRHWKLYDQFVPVCERVLRETSTGEAPWTIVEATDDRYRELTVGRHVLGAMEERLEKARRRARGRPARPAEPPAAEGPTVLSTVDLGATVSDARYSKQLRKLQGRLNRLSRRALELGTSTMLVFEGWDAAGKGGAIRRVTRALDARQYRTIRIAAPTDEERARHYLWRFWRHLPRAGHVTIFDRSWYGRVLVERVEGFASEAEWGRAYHEINEFEELSALHGSCICKFWLHVDKDEQARRFEAREKTSYKQYKITAEDHRNREKWDLYEAAVNEMIERTSTSELPWTIVPANDKRVARLTVLETVCERLEKALDAASARARGDRKPKGKGGKKKRDR